MKTFSNLFYLLMFVITLQGCACGYVEQGWTGIEAKNFGGDRGGIEERTPGRYIYKVWSTDFYYFPNFKQVVSWTEGNDPSQGSSNDEALRVLSGDQLEFVVDMGISYYINPITGCSAEIFRTYRKPIEQITSGDVRLTVRDRVQDVFSQYAADSIYGAGRPRVVNEVKSVVTASLGNLARVDGVSCFIVNDIYLMRLEPPASVKEAVNKKIKQAQEAQQAVEKTRQIREEAEQARIKAEMDSRNNRQLTESLTPEILQNKFLEKWDGHLPTVMSDRAAQLLLNLPAN